jgi:hypothetical protein
MNTNVNINVLLCMCIPWLSVGLLQILLLCAEQEKLDNMVNLICSVDLLSCWNLEA